MKDAIKFLSRLCLYNDKDIAEEYIIPYDKRHYAIQECCLYCNKIS